MQTMPDSRLDEYILSKSLKTAAVADGAPAKIRTIHAAITKLCLSRFTVLMTALIDAYLKTGHLISAHILFDDLPDPDTVSWTSMIVGHARHRRHQDSLSLFRRMLSSDTRPNAYTFSGALTACTGLSSLGHGKQIHAQLLLTSANGSIEPVLQNGLLDMYARCGCLPSARVLFDRMPVRSTIAWNAMMSSYLHWEQAEFALRIMASMVSSGVKPDDFSYAICTKACAALASLRQGTQIHAYILKDGYHSDLIITNALVDMYAKCGCIASCKIVFDSTQPSSDPVLWTAMVSALGKCGHAQEAIRMFEQMAELNIERDAIAYLAVLSSCSHGGLVSEGWHYFRSICDEGSHVSMMPEHYGCMVDLLCRNGLLEEALDIIEHMTCEPSVAVWSTVLNACWMRGNYDVGKLAALRLNEMDPGCDSSRVVLSCIHAAEQQWNETLRIRESMKAESVKKEPGCSWIEVNDGVHVFLTTDKSHPEMGVVLNTLDALSNYSQITFAQR